MNEKQLILMGAVLAYDVVAQRPFSNGLYAKALRDESFKKLSKYNQNIIKKMLKA